MALQRLSADWIPKRRLPDSSSSTSQTDLALVYGKTEMPLWTKKLGDVIDAQGEQYGSKVAAVFSWQNQSLSYLYLAQRSKVLAYAMLSMGLQHGDCVGILAGNCYQYLEVFLGSARIGCPVVVLNTTYSPNELKNALAQSACKIVFIPSHIGQRSFRDHVTLISMTDTVRSGLQLIVHLKELSSSNQDVPSQTYASFAGESMPASGSESALKRAESAVQSTDVLNLQFTSGTTGAPKAAMLTHVNLINNGRFVGEAMCLKESDIVCCPPPLFHCFGLVMGFLASFCHGSSIVFPAEQFDPNLTLDAVAETKVTALLGVPTMFVAMLEANEKKQLAISTVRTGLAAGSPVPAALMNQLREKMGIEAMLIAYGMTETSPVTFITSLNDSEERRAKTLGRVMPHTGAKIISKDGKGTILKRGETGELCTSGFALQKGYWKNEEKTLEVMKVDEQGTTWMHTGDECKIDNEGYCWITGRIKDVIIRGGENIFPIEIEERLLAHPAVSEASVVGLRDDRYGEIVACFVRASERSRRPEDDALRQWVREGLARQKAPKYVFWIGDAGVGNDFPKTGSGKHQKHLLRDLGDKLVKRLTPRAKL